ncbi:MAG: cation-translocating P-type ATPase C-terminal domain-containing protein [Candidatus Jettenia sp. CY-1]|nr:MAG: cation-translocating P-type ATPase C-terminal domain-containing protein [Candidatus Jettenia sp. CY-1]
MVPALALGTEPPERGIIDKPPRPKNKRLLDIPLLLRAYCFLGPMEAVACMAGLLYLLPTWLGARHRDAGRRTYLPYSYYYDPCCDHSNPNRKCLCMQNR